MTGATRQRLNEAVIGVAIFATSAVWGTVYWTRSFQAGRQPVFYQANFEPAVLAVCGHGFLIAHPPVPAIVDFLNLKTDSVTCDQISADQSASTYGLFQKTWLYLMWTVIITWRLLGISWSGMGPLFGALFGATIVAAYGIFRFGMGRLMSIACATALAVSSVHLRNLPHLRDYAKAPITLILIWLLVALVARKPGWRRLLLLGAAYGVVLGIGYGFRSDFLVEIPAFFIAVFVFVDGGLRRNLPMKIAAAAVCAAVFVATASPVISAVRRGGGCQWHAALLGMTDPFTAAMKVTPAPYSFGQDYSDGLVYSIAVGYGLRMHPGIGHVDYCSPAYDAVTGQYLVRLIRTFPGDMLTRTFASMWGVASVPFRVIDQPLPGLAGRMFTARRIVLTPLRGTGPLFVAIALVALFAASWRLGLFALFFFFYFGGYPMLQFDVRHYFHLEFVTWWAIGFLASQAVARLREGGDWRRRFSVTRDGRPLRWGLAAAGVGVIAMCLFASLWALRLYQHRVLTRAFQDYVDAPREAVAIAPSESGTLYPVMFHRDERADPTPVAMLAIDLDAARCPADAGVTMTYHPPEDVFTHRVALGTGASSGVARVFEGVYAGFDGVVFDHIVPGCVKEVAQVREPERIPLILNVTLSPSWADGPLHQELAPHEGAMR